RFPSPAPFSIKRLRGCASKVQFNSAAGLLLSPYVASTCIPGDDAAALKHYHRHLVKTLVRSKLSPIIASLFYSEALSEFTHFLERVEHGDPKAAAELLPIVYEELR